MKAEIQLLPKMFHSGRRNMYFEHHKKQWISTSHLPTITKFNGVLFPKFVISLRFNGTILQKQKVSHIVIIHLTSAHSLLTEQIT